MFQTIGVCGTGNMGRAIVKGLVAAHAIVADHIYLYNIHKEKAEALAKETGAVVVDTPEELARQSQGLIMAVKPNLMELALEAVRESLPADSVLISIAAGISLEKLAFTPVRKRKSSGSCPIRRPWSAKAWPPYRPMST